MCSEKPTKGNVGERLNLIEVQEIGSRVFTPLLAGARTSFLHIGGPTAVNRRPGLIQMCRTFEDQRPGFAGTLIEARRTPDHSDFMYDVIRIDGYVYKWDPTYTRRKKGGGVLRGTYLNEKRATRDAVGAESQV